MSLEQFMPELKQRCGDCGAPLEDDVVRRLKRKDKEKVLCRSCFRKRLGAKRE